MVDALRSHARHPDGFQVYAGRGWIGLVRECHNELELAFPNYELLAVKEKYGELAFQAFPRASQPGGAAWTIDESHAVDRITDEFRELSTQVCEECGRPGQLRETRSWELTLCDSCDQRIADPERQPERRAIALARYAWSVPSGD